MRKVYLFLAASLGCLILAAVSLASPGAMVLFPDAAKRAQCSRLMQSYYEGRVPMPEHGTPERASYLDCYQVICGSR